MPAPEGKPNGNPESSTSKPTPEELAAACSMQPLTVSKAQVEQFFSKASKQTVFAVFLLYAIGFIIWNSYLATFGVFSVEFLQIEYFSAALCYAFLVATFSLPPILIWDRWLGIGRAKKREPLSTVIFLWYAVSSQFIRVFLPDSELSKSTAVLTLYIAIGIGMVLYVATHLFFGLNTLFKWSVQRGWKWNPQQAYEWIRKWDWGTPCIFLFGVVSLFSTDELNKFFLLSCTFLYPMVFYSLGGTVNTLWSEGGAVTRGLVLTVSLLIVISNIRVFGAVQFGKIDRRVGGGKPEIAYIKFSPQHADLATALRIPVATNILDSFHGPVSVLVRTEKSFIFVNEAEQSLPDYVTNESVLRISTNISVLATNQAPSIVTNKDLTLTTNMSLAVVSTPLQTNLTRNVPSGVRNPVKLTAKQVRTELIDAVVFGK